ncbi:hypothetical protein, partial [Shewanella xiamenensis]|uniref:hypothetical protein n=1 Tax=Shewanella xiamenensis TaxID=332186 RepID=UPI00313D7E61
RLQLELIDVVIKKSSLCQRISGRDMRKKKAAKSSAAFLTEFGGGTAVSVRNPRVQLPKCQNRKAIITNGLSVEYCQGAALRIRTPRVQLSKFQKQKSHHC